jgi:hypothetical protein
MLLLRLAILAGCLALTGCVSIQPSTPVPNGAAPRLTLERALPEKLPAKSSPFSHSQFVLLGAENFLGALSPIPFVADMVTAGVHSSRARDFEEKYGDVHPYLVAVAVLKDSPLLARPPGASFVLKPFVFLQQCSDDRYRLAYVFHVEQGDWVGRYMYHLPTTYSPADVADPAPAVLATLKRELQEGAVLLRGLLERDAAGQLPATGAKAKVGSPHLLGVSPMGLIGTSMFAAKDAQVVEETPDHVVVRIPGDLTQAASVGGLFFGVHWLRRDQLETFQKL